MARLEITWNGGSNASTSEPKLGPTLPTSAIPTAYYLTSADAKDATDSNNMETAVLKDEAVALGLKMFRTIKVSGDKIGKDHPLGGAKLPRFVFVSREGKVVGKMEGRMAPNNLFAAMKRAAAVDYKTDMDKMVKDARNFLTALDKIENGKKNLQTKTDSESRKAGGRLNAFQDAQSKKEAAALTADEKKLLEQERALFQFELRDSKPVAVSTATK